MKVFRTAEGVVAQTDSDLRRLAGVTWDAIFTRDDVHAWLQTEFDRASRIAEVSSPLAPITTQEVWAAGVTYFRSRTARMTESRDAGGGDFYDRVYNADRPELFFKATPHRVVGPDQSIRIRGDSKWNVPEPELTLAINATGAIIGYTVGNDVSSRDIEGANPLYLPQAKVYVGSCALGPGILMTPDELPPGTPITLRIDRGDQAGFEGSTTLAQMRRRPRELVDYLYRENAFPAGCFLMTGTGIIPPDSFTLQPGDCVTIEIEPLGKLINTVA
jgi:2-dehydro-3-deoxy-D-arabinonate dehydratase